MAKNIRRESGSGFVHYRLDLGGAASSGDVTLFGTATPVLLLDDTDSDDIATCEIIGCMTVAELSVVGADDVGNAAITAGDKVFIDGAAINADAVNGTFLGYALAGVASGATTAIDVALVG